MPAREGSTPTPPGQLDRGPIEHRGRSLEDRRTAWALFSAFTGLGSTAAFVPALIPLAADLHRAQVAVYLPGVPAMFLGLFIGITSSLVASPLCPLRQLLLVGSLLQAAAVILLSMGLGPVAFVVGAGIAGAGFGVVEVCGTALARQLAGPGTSRLMTRLTACSAVAAAACPMALVGLPPVLAPTIAGTIVATFHLFTAGLLVSSLRRRRPDLRQLTASTTKAATSAGGERPRVWTRARVAAAFALALYVGVESAFAGWSAISLLSAVDLDPDEAAAGTSAFWILMAIGRTSTATLLRTHISPPRLLASCAYLTAGALVLASAVGSSTMLGLGAIALAVTAFSPYYSLILGTHLATVDRRQVEQVTGLLVAAGAAGGFLLPALLLAAGSDPTQPATLVFCLLLLLTAAILGFASREGAGSRSPMHPG